MPSAAMPPSSASLPPRERRTWFRCSSASKPMRGLPALARELFAIQAKEYVQLQAQISEVDAKLTAWHRADECSRRLAKIPSVGPIGAVLLRMKTPDPAQFRSGRPVCGLDRLDAKGSFDRRQGQAR